MTKSAERRTQETSTGKRTSFRRIFLTALYRQLPTPGCQLCGLELREDRYELAHVTPYSVLSRLGKKDEPRDFLVLCHRCHLLWEDRQRGFVNQALARDGLAVADGRKLGRTLFEVEWDRFKMTTGKSLRKYAADKRGGEKEA